MKEQEIEQKERKLFDEYYITLWNKIASVREEVDKNSKQCYHENRKYIQAILDYLNVDLGYTPEKYYCKKRKH